jgi:hypothetical protein
VESGGKERSRPKDLVDNMLDALKLAPGEEKKVHAWPFYFIKPKDFAHRFEDPILTHRPYNRAAAELFPKEFDEFGTVDSVGINIDLPRIVKSQLIRRGVPEENIHLEHAYLSDELPTTRNGGGRYLVTTVRHR